MRFQPSAYAAPPAFPPDYRGAGSHAALGEMSPETTGQLVEIGGKLTNMGVDAWQRSADKNLEKWRKTAKKKGAKKRQAEAARAQQAAAAAAAAAPPVPVQAGMSPVMKWGLIAAGVGLIGFAAYMILRKKEEPHKPKHNPKRSVRRASMPARPRDVRAAPSEFASRRAVEASVGGAASGGGSQEDDRGVEESEAPVEEESLGGFEDAYDDPEGYDGYDEGGE